MKFSLFCFMLVFLLFFAGCTQITNDYSGEYYYSVPTDKLFTPKLELSESGEIVLKVGYEIYFAGTYSVENNDMVICIIETNSEFETYEINSIVIEIIDKNTLEITCNKPLPSNVDTIYTYTFKKAK